MARLFEYQGKDLLKRAGFEIPPGKLVSTPEDAESAARELIGDSGGGVVVKAQVWVTGRKSKGLIKFCKTPETAREAASEMLGQIVKNFPIENVLVEKMLDIDRELFAAVLVDDAAQAPIVIFSSFGGSGIEEIAREHPEAVARKHIDIKVGLRDFEARELVRQTTLDRSLYNKAAVALVNLYKAAHMGETRSIEINPLIVTKDGKWVAADCHATVDDYAVFRHPELGIEIARELDHPITQLERIAYNVEKSDYRGTFYFFQIIQNIPRDGKTQNGEDIIGFHGAGGGGSMMSMDALGKYNFAIANFTDTSGNPPASKVYRAAKIILAQPHLRGYFASGSGVASQEQFHSARGFVKAFREVGLSIPAVIRLGGNKEEMAIEILKTMLSDIGVPVEGYGKDDSAVFCAERLRKLVDGSPFTPKGPDPISNPDPPKEPYSFKTLTGRWTVDHAKCTDCDAKPCVAACHPNILELKDGKIVLNITEEEAQKGRCTECLACEITCWHEAGHAIRIDLPIEGLHEYLYQQEETIAQEVS
ncbi:MAG TPA: succinyl-CoA synthetase subunit beta [Firmicutes bacterium]|nr:succinyl-CoA synthetase subunit beta [Bacillota bacterium]